MSERRDRRGMMEHVDYTNLGITASEQDIAALIHQAVTQKCASVCIPPCHVKYAKSYITESGWQLPVCTVISFPNGYMSTEAKVLETQEALKDGADEIDMVANISDEIAGKSDKLLEEIRAVKGMCNRFELVRGNKVILKVIIEASMLDASQIENMCSICMAADADYIKTSTGVNGKAELTDVKIMSESIHNLEQLEEYKGKHLKIKAAGGIRTFADAQKYLEAGADRIGTSGLKES